MYICVHYIPNTGRSLGEGNRMSGGFNGIGEMRMNMLLATLIFLS